jgi:hypothetical protein
VEQVPLGDFELPLSKAEILKEGAPNHSHANDFLSSLLNTNNVLNLTSLVYLVKMFDVIYFLFDKKNL